MPTIALNANSLTHSVLNLAFCAKPPVDGDLAVQKYCIFFFGICTNCTAADTPDQSAEKLQFQRQQPSFPPTQNVNSAASRQPPARQFSGKYANCAKYANHLQHLLQFDNLFDNDKEEIELRGGIFDFQKIPM